MISTLGRLVTVVGGLLVTADQANTGTSSNPKTSRFFMVIDYSSSMAFGLESAMASYSYARAPADSKHRLR